MDKEFIYREFRNRENNISHAPYNPEFAFYYAVKKGNIQKVKEYMLEPLINKKGLGILSYDENVNIKYHFIITTAMIARSCIEGGMEHEVAYNLSDYYILKADSLKSKEEISNLHYQMILDYTSRMKNLFKSKICSKPVSLALDFIYNNLHKKITLEMICMVTNLNKCYISKLFKKEMAIGINDYILKQKIETAENMLKFSNYTILEISNTLAFSSQSHFTEVFKKYNYITPKQYQKENYQKNNISKD